jgi:tungstate transport system ATP-binding protein
MNMLFHILEAQNLHVTRAGAHLLDVPSLTLHEGQTLSLIGPNGAGKTTFMQTLAYLLRQFQGEIAFRGRKVGPDLSIFEYRRKLAMVFQEPLLFDTTVFNNVASGLRIRGIGKKEMYWQVTDNLDRFGITHLSDRSARTLSGGEAQRTSLARAFAIKPEVLFLDEPFASLDPPSRESLVEDLQRVLKETGTTAILATHDRLEALRLSDRMAVMNGGKVLQQGPPDDVMNRPVDEFVASFVGVETILNGNVTHTYEGSFIASVSGHEIEAVADVHAGEEVALCIRPENVTLTIHPLKETTSARNVFPGKIVGITPMGLFHKVQLDCGFPLVAYVTHHSLENLMLAEGNVVNASFKATAIHVVKRRAERRG